MERWYLRECVRSISVNGLANGRLVYDAAFRPHFRDHRQCDIDGCLGASHAGEEQERPPPVNFINCWTNGEQAAAFRKADFAHTAVGPAPHRTAIVFWAILFERCVDVRRPAAALLLVRDALMVSTFAATVDYGVTPKRFTSRWTFVLSKRPAALTYAAMVLRLAADASINRSADC